MLNNPVPLILLFTAIGFVIGAVVAYFVARNDARKQQNPGELDLIEERNKRFQEIAGLWRERTGGKLAIWLGNRMLGDPNLVDAAERQRLADAGHELLAWLGLEEKPVSRSPEPPVVARAGTGPLMAKLAQPERPLEDHAPALADLTPGDESVKPPKPLSIVEQIDEILQGMLKDTPLASRSIKLVEDPREGVVVLVGLERYKGVDSVPDPDIKTALRRAAGEWERRTGKIRH